MASHTSYLISFPSNTSFSGAPQKSLFREDGTLNLIHRFVNTRDYIDFLLKDRFHTLLSLRWVYVVSFVFITVAFFAFLFSGILYVATSGDYQSCLGNANSILDYYFFVVETMFSIGYGSPRFPSCHTSSIAVMPIALSGVLLNSLIIGLVFQKFSSASRRKWAILFSNNLLVSTDVQGDAGRIRRTNTFKCAYAPPDICQNANETDFIKSASKNNLKADRNMQSLNTSKPLNQSTNQESPYTISFRLLNITETSFFHPRLALYLLVKHATGVSIRKFSTFHTDTPLEFMALPVTITLDSRDINSPLADIDMSALRDLSDQYELLVSLSFTDNKTSRTVEVSKSWKFDCLTWGTDFTPIVHMCTLSSNRMFDIDVDRLSSVEDAYTERFIHS